MHLSEVTCDDPLITCFQGSPRATHLDRLDLDSPALQTLEAADVHVSVPLVSQGELIGLLNLGQRLSTRPYSAEDLRLLTHLATQAVPAVRVGQLVRQQQVEVQARERLEQELRVAQLIQQTLLPDDVPRLPGWQVAAYYQPARAVGGDFYDFLHLSDGRVGLIVGDVAGKGMPAALLMASTRSFLRAAAQRLDSPGQVLEQVNDLLCPDMPRNMFVTCLYAILDPVSGRLAFANAGHTLPYRRVNGAVVELEALGMPLGIVAGMRYEEKATTLEPKETLLFYSDGLVEAHNARRQMFSFPRLESLIAHHPGGPAIIDFFLSELAVFTGSGWEQEDDVTLMAVQRSGGDS
jgi:serine phosphatase RsbU (regulator of sigma subunit)